MTSTIQMNSANKKIFLYQITCKKKKTEKEEDFPYIMELFKKMQSCFPLLEYNNTRDNRWYGIESVNVGYNDIEIVLISCKYKYKPNLINIEHKTERPSPKEDNEGDKEKTHVLIKGNAIAYENKRNGTSISVFVRFLNTVWKEIKQNLDDNITKVTIQQILDNDFLETIKKSQKIKNVKFSVYSSLLGSDYFNFSEDNGVQDTYVVEVKAKKRNTLNKENFIKNIERMLAEREKIERITVDIRDEDDNPRIINTEEFSKQFNIYVEKDHNGEIISADIFDKMRDLIWNFLKK